MVIGRGRGVAGCYCPYRARVWHGYGIFSLTAWASGGVFKGGK